MFLQLKRDPERSEEEEQQHDDKHLYECLRIRDHANLTPIHWAATQDNVSKRQKMFAYLDRCMPGVLDSRYNKDWFQSWANARPWVLGLVRFVAFASKHC
jgi:ankyrin repeat protein